MKGYELLSRNPTCPEEVARAVCQHHERWDGSGYPYGLKKSEICHFAQIIAITDIYCAMRSERPGRKAYLSHETMEYIMAYSGDQFNPKLVEIFVKQVPCYPTGLNVKLNTGEVGIVSNANIGLIGRPVVRICYDENLKKQKQPYDIDLS